MSILVAAITIASTGSTRSIRAQQLQHGKDDLQVVTIRPNFFVISGAGGNIAVQLGPAGAGLVDTGPASMSDTVLAVVKTLTSQRIRYIFNTSADSDHVGGNETVSKAGL